jgi:hypothetical protein
VYEGEGGSLHTIPILCLVIISVLFSVSDANARMNQLGVKFLFPQENLRDLNEHLKALTKYKETVVLKSVQKNINYFMKENLLGFINFSSPDQKFHLEKFVDTIGAVFDTVGLLKVFQSNKKFTIFKDIKKVGYDIKDMFLNKFKYSPEKNIIFLGNVAKLFLHASVCLQENVVLVIEVASSAGAFTNLLTSIKLLADLHDDARKTANTLSAKEKEELLFGDLDIPVVEFHLVESLYKNKKPLSSLVLGGKRKKPRQTKKKPFQTKTKTNTKTKSTKHTRTKRKKYPQGKYKRFCRE